MAIESVIGRSNQSYVDQRQDDKVSKKETTQENQNQTVPTQESKLEIDSSGYRVLFGTEVKELLEQAKNGNLEASELQEKMKDLVDEYRLNNSFTYQNSLDFAKINGSFAQAQANVSQATVAKLLQ